MMVALLCNNLMFFGDDTEHWARGGSQNIDVLLLYEEVK